MVVSKFKYKPNPGRTILAIEDAYRQLNLQSESDINWLQWLDSSSQEERRGVGGISQTSTEESLENLYNLLEETMKIEPSLDVIMLGQLQDCYEQLGIQKYHESNPYSF